MSGAPTAVRTTRAPTDSKTRRKRAPSFASRSQTSTSGAPLPRLHPDLGPPRSRSGPSGVSVPIADGQVLANGSYPPRVWWYSTRLEYHFEYHFWVPGRIGGIVRVTPIVRNRAVRSLRIEFLRRAGSAFALPGSRSAPVQSTEPGSWRRAAQHDELVAQQEVLVGDDGARRKESDENSDYLAKEVEHRAIVDPLPSQVQPRRARASSACASSFCGAQVRDSLGPRHTLGSPDRLRLPALRDEGLRKG
jgi:hypothetical protein